MGSEHPGDRTAGPAEGNRPAGPTAAGRQSGGPPLEGIRALEWGAYHAGPGSLAILGDLGAEVIKIEMPKTGEPLRNLVRFGNFPVARDGHSIFYEGTNRHKKSIALDVSRQEGKQIVRRLVSKCDVFVTNFRPKAVKKQGLTYEDLRPFNERLIYVALTAFGSRGPDRDAGGFDFLGQARSGLMLAVGEPEMPPLVSHFGLIDQMTSITTSHAILTALYARERTGQGQEVRLSLLSSAVFLQYFTILNALVMGQNAPRHHRHSADPVRNHYQCQDGRWVCLTLAQQPEAWGRLCQAIGRPDLAGDPRFATREKLYEHREELIAALDGVFAARPRDEWVRALKEHDVFCSPVNTALEYTADPQVAANDYVVGLAHRLFGDIKVPAYPVEFSGTPARPGFTAPRLGEHTLEVLRDIGGYSEREIAALRENGVIDSAGAGPA